MNCPACEHNMTEVSAEDIKVDVCIGGCGGLWFDNHELKKFDEQHEAVGQNLLEVEYDPEVVVDEAQRRDCPHCEDIIMMRHFSSIKREVEVDECPGCGGFFLDRGELNTLRQEYVNEEARMEAANEMFGDMFDDDLEDLEEVNWQRVEAGKRLGRMFRYLLPSHYIPGKQKWGVF